MTENEAENLLDSESGQDLFAFHTDARTAICERIKSEGIEPDVSNFNSVITTLCEAGDVISATKLLEEMIQMNVKPNDYTFCSLLKCCNCQERGDYMNALRFYRQALSFGFNKEESNLTSRLLEVCKTGIRKSDSWQDAVFIFAALHELEIKGDAELINALLEACLNQPSKVLEIFIQMEKELEIKPTLETYTLVIQSCVSNGDMLRALEVFDLLHMRYLQEQDPSLKPNFILFEVLLEGCHKRVMPEKAMEIMLTMDELEIELTTLCLDHLINTMEMGTLWDTKIKKQAKMEDMILTLDVLRPFLGD